MYSCNELNVMIFANKFNHDQVRFRGVFFPFDLPAESIV